jgi:hypothetical protein
MTTHWQDDPYEDNFDDYDEWEDEDEDEDIWPHDYEDYPPDYDGFEYDDDPVPLTLLERLQNKIGWICWRLEHWWDYGLNMRRCGDCGKRYRFGNHDQCIPF